MVTGTPTFNVHSTTAAQTGVIHALPPMDQAQPSTSTSQHGGQASLSTSVTRETHQWLLPISPPASYMFIFRHYHQSQATTSLLNTTQNSSHHPDP